MCLRDFAFQQKKIKMDESNITKENNDEIHIDVEQTVKEVAPSKEDAMKSEESASQSFESNNEIQEENVKEVAPSMKSEESASQSLESCLEKEIAALPNEDCDYRLIYKVSEKYRKVKEESYTPLVVSIGPLHHGKSYLQPMETYKLKCLNNLINLYGISLKKLCECATAEGGDVRSHYPDFKFDPKDFSKMILLDGIFIILLISKNQFSKVNALILKQNTWMLSDIMHDMLLLENQLPFYFVKKLLDILVNPDQEHTTSDPFYEAFYEDLRNYFRNVGITKNLKVNLECKYAWHLVDFLLKLHLPSEEKQSSEDGKVEYNTRSSSELQGVGVRFCQPPDEALFEMTFNKDTGELCIPQLTVNDTTETFFRNLIAFEQSQHQRHITSYVTLMDSLINTAEDVKLLIKNGIIVNSLGEDHLVADLFNNLHKEVIEDGRDFYFADICKDLNEYSKDWVHQWRSSCFHQLNELKNKYFSNPWSAISFLAATVVVGLTIAQTVCAFRASPMQAQLLHWDT